MAYVCVWNDSRGAHRARQRGNTKCQDWDPIVHEDISEEVYVLSHTLRSLAALNAHTLPLSLSFTRREGLGDGLPAKRYDPDRGGVRTCYGEVWSPYAVSRTSRMTIDFAPKCKIQRFAFLYVYQQ